jgi:hypothetical protein
MVLFPSSTRKGIRLPKESFYTHATLTPTVKRAMVDDVEQIVWSHSLTAETLNVNSNDKVRQIDVLTITLKKRECNEKIFEVIERAIPRHILFILRFKSECRLLIHFKEAYENVKGKYRIVESYFTEWQPEEEVTLAISGLDLERIYHNFIYQIAGNKLKKESVRELGKAVEQHQEAEKIRKKIARLEDKMRKEVQYNLQLQLSAKIKELKKKLTDIF